VLAPLTRGGNLPYRRLCVEQGARVTFSEMAFATKLVKDLGHERALLRHHASESCFGVQVAVRKPELAVAAARLAVEAGAAFLDVNCGCPINSVVSRGEGAALLEKPRRLERLLRPLRDAIEIPLLLKIRTGYREGAENAVEVARVAEACGVDAITLHGRTREQRYRRPADWSRIAEVAAAVSIPVIGNGDILRAADALHRLATSGCTAVMAARGALVKPWIFADLAAGHDRPRAPAERLAVMRRWLALAVEHWGADAHAAKRIRWFLEFHVDFWRRYVPEDAETTGENTLQGRPSFRSRDELEAILQAPGAEGLARACDLVLEGSGLPPEAFNPSATPPDETAGGWS
jgi:tRNA-dihydrouridine synthase 3